MLKRSKGILSIILVVITSLSFQSQKSEVEEYSAKAAFIYNFTKFVEWEGNGAESGNNFVIGVAGESAIYKPLQGLAASKKINNKKIEIIKFGAPSELSSCQILFVPESVSFKGLKEYTSSRFVKNTLVITEKQGYLEYGAGINFLIIEDRIKFEINLASLNKANLKASSQLLKLAQNVQEQ